MRETTREGIPSPNASNAPAQVTDTADTTKPKLMTCKAVTPMAMVSEFSVKSPISCAGSNQQHTVPSAMIPMVSASVNR